MGHRGLHMTSYSRVRETVFLRLGSAYRLLVTGERFKR
jgi:hypothetical protein